MGLLLSSLVSLTAFSTVGWLMVLANWYRWKWLGRTVGITLSLVMTVLCAVLWIQLFFFLNDIGTSYVNYITVAV